jgi:hypothetical protein
MSLTHTLGYNDLRIVERAMAAQRALVAAMTYTQYTVDKDNGVVGKPSNPKTMYLAQEAQCTTLGVFWHGCTCMDVQNQIKKIDQQITDKAKKERVPEANTMRSTCQCKHFYNGVC